MNRMQKPLSPHLQIYSPQLTSVLSILHRFTGVGFTAALVLACAWLHALSEGMDAYASFCSWISQPLIKGILYLVLGSVYYHMINGIRYLLWSMGHGFELRSVYNSGWIVCACVCILIALTVYFS
jgi:succinate dehydrogenase / fumarate reductase cytochrome b subunit